MKISGVVQRIVFPTQVVLLVLLCVFWVTGAWATEQEADGQGSATEGVVGQRNYASLTSLVAMVGSDAMEHLHGFFAAEPVTIEPFIVLSEFHIYIFEGFQTHQPAQSIFMIYSTINATRHYVDYIGDNTWPESL